ncbi:hypothetical protein OPT61_g7451 [Boeremia exigua]|uniref:Uncharacterized protein n=1 Tax=Boeremia exigua TaxID=749465 RepID=A0ACC2I261_9PLEO|nr:hypothetical protein OPT61_g7451 [Boeremia exigua]
MPVDQPSDGQLGARLLKESFCGNVLYKISERCGAERCRCIACLFRHMLCLPPEILSGHILPYVKQSYVRQTILAYGEVSKVISSLQDHPAGSWDISCKGSVFQTRISFGKVSYLTGLFDKAVSHSKAIKPWNEKPRYIVVWLDKIGIVDVKFLPSAKVQDSIQSEHTWVYAFPFTETVQVKSKGVFLERIMGSTSNGCPRILWNTTESPKLFEENPFPQIAAEMEYLVHYVSLRSASALSVGFSTGTLFAIKSHRNNCDFPKVLKSRDADMWLHCPLRLSENEHILHLWGVSYKCSNLGTCALIIQTQYKLVWLGHYLSPGTHELLEITHIVSSPTFEIYYSEQTTAFSQVLRPRSATEAAILVPPDFPTYRTPVPAFTFGMSISDLFYSEAPLENVTRVQSCYDTGRCIGLLLDYEKHSQTVGDFRYDKEVSHYFQQPRSIGLGYEQQTGCLEVKFSRQIAWSDTAVESYMQPMRGAIVWWYTTNMCYRDLRVRRLGGGGLVEGGADGAELDVGEDNAGVGRVALDVNGAAGASGAGTAGNTGLVRVGVGGEGGVEPQHVDGVVVPQAHDEDVAACKRGGHAVHAAEVGEGAGVAEDGLLGGAERVADRVASDARDGRVAVLEDFAVLDVEAADLADAGAGADELRDNGHLGLGVELGAGAIEVLHAHAVAVEVTTVLVAHTLVAVGTVTALDLRRAGIKSGVLARVGGVGGRDGVGFPDIHLGAAGTHLAISGVRVVGRTVPALRVGLAVDPLDVVGALGVAVSCRVLVVALVEATVGGHLDKVESTVQTAREVGNIDIEGELLVDEVEHLILGIRLHEVGTRSYISRVLALGNELQGQGIVGGGNTVGTLNRQWRLAFFSGSKLTRVVGTINGTVLGAAITIRAERRIPSVASEAVGGATNVVRPTPVGVEHNRRGLLATAVAAGTSAGLPVNLGVVLRLISADLLGADGAQEGERGESERPVHLVCWDGGTVWDENQTSAQASTSYIENVARTVWSVARKQRIRTAVRYCEAQRSPCWTTQCQQS